MEEINDTLDLSNKDIKKLGKPSAAEAQNVTNLILDDNELQRLDNIDSFTKLQKLSVVRNQLLRMYGVCRLHSLHTLNLAHNGILTIEGLKEIVGLKWLCLAGNNIKTIEHLNTNVNIEHLDLSENGITHIGDLSYIKNLKELLLHNNKIGHLTQCDRNLPISITTLTLANNNISDLNEISHLVHLTNLTSISIANNPCVIMTGKAIGFDYRPFVINWCLNVNVIDGYVVDAIESLRAEWLYSQGRGRHFRVGDHKELVQYLSSVCPLTGEALETEEDRKLHLILSKAQHHQQQLRDQQTNGETPIPSPSTRKRGSKYSPRYTARSSSKSKSPDRMTSSCYSTNSILDNSSLMSQSLDPTILRQSVSAKTTNEMTSSQIIEKCLDAEPINSPLQALSKMVPVPESLMSPDYRPSPLGKLATPTTTPVSNKNVAAKLNQPVRSPKNSRSTTNRPKSSLATTDPKKNLSPAQQRKQTNSATSNKRQDRNRKPSILRKSVSSEDESEMYDSKLQTIQQKAEERRQLKDAESSSAASDDKLEHAAVCIQKAWRGYYTRNKNKDVQLIFRTLQSQRAEQYIQKLATDMETTKAALESERKIQMLQTEAISALWKKISALQPSDEQSGSVTMTNTSGDNSEIVKELARTCTALQTQISQLQSSMQDIIKVMSLFSQTAGISHALKDNGIATQTEIVAVHTPQGDAGKAFPFQKHTSSNTRPSSLPLPVNQRKKDQPSSSSDLREYAGTLVDDVIKTVSEVPEDVETGKIAEEVMG